VVVSYLLPLALLAAFANVWFLAVAALGVSTLAYLGRRFYRYFIRQRGLWFALRVFPVHYVYHLYNGFSFAVGTSLHLALKWFGIALPGALPLDAWSGNSSPLFPVLARRRALHPRHVAALGAQAASGNARLEPPA
jgi:phosphoglycerol transferase MdoB-like AlkP superfamily enzyme